MGQKKHPRLLSIDAYRGFVMLALMSGGFAIGSTLDAHPEVEEQRPWLSQVAYHFEHVEWAGCSFWDLIQPSFMFLVGAAIPFSRRASQRKGLGGFSMFCKACMRSLLLIGLGILLYSQDESQSVINFKLVNVLTQIGLGYMFVYIMANWRIRSQLAAIAVILVGYGGAFYVYEPPADDVVALANLLDGNKAESVFDEERTELPEDMEQYIDHRSNFNKHTNAAAGFDRWFLNLFPRNEEEWRGRQFWINGGGYQTLNFIPSIATMIFGLIAGLILIGEDPKGRKLTKLLGASLACFAVTFALDTDVWPMQIDGLASWSGCPVVKRIWTPTWALFSAGWAFGILSAFYILFDILPLNYLAFPMKVIGMNSIVAYCLTTHGPFRYWFSRMFRKTLETVDAGIGRNLTSRVYGDGTYAAVYESIAVLGLMWLICFWLYRRRLFVRI